MTPAGFEATAWSWVDHLRGGGTTPWLEWARRTEPDANPEPPRPGTLPGAAQLEVVRRMAARPAAVRARDFTALADLALDRPGPGRGMARLPLTWPEGADGQDELRVGAPPTDPVAVPVEELVRVAVGLLTEVLLALPPSDAPDPAPRRRLFARRFHLAGAPATTARVRSELAAAGHVEGGRSPEVLLFAEPLDVALAQIWSMRVQHGAPVRWVTFARRWARRDQLPPSADLPAIAAYWGARVGNDRVHVVAGPDAVRTAAEVLRLRLPTAEAAVAPDPRSLAPGAVDLLRRLNRVLNVRVPEDRRDGYLRRMVELLPEDADPALGVPEECRGWLDGRARRVADALRAGGYAVHGDLDRIAPRHDGAAHPRRLDVLDLVLDTTLRMAELEA